MVWRFVYSRYGNSSLSSEEAFLMERRLASLHETPFEHQLELARYVIFRIYYRLFVTVQNGQAKIASRKPSPPFLFFTTGSHQFLHEGILKRGGKKEEDGDKKVQGKERKIREGRKIWLSMIEYFPGCN